MCLATYQYSPDVIDSRLEQSTPTYCSYLSKLHPPGSLSTLGAENPDRTTDYPFDLSASLLSLRCLASASLHTLHPQSRGGRERRSTNVVAIARPSHICPPLSRNDVILAALITQAPSFLSRSHRGRANEPWVLIDHV